MSTGLSRGNSKEKQFIEDNANNFVVIQFVDMAADFPSGTLAAAADGQQYVIDSNFATANAAWGTITGGADKAIIRYNASTSKWVVEFAPASVSGASLYDQSSDTIFTFDATDWNIASGAGGGVKNFASAQASGYKAADLTQGNSAVFGTVGGGIQGVISQEKVAPLDGKKSFLYTAAASSQNDWFYFTVDIDLYARGGAIADVFDYTWDGEDDAIKVQIFDPTFTTEHSTELNLLKNTDNDYKKSRNSRTIYAHPDTQTQVLVGFQVVGAVTGGEKLVFDNFKVTDDIGEIGVGATSEVRLESDSLLNGETNSTSYQYNYLIYNIGKDTAQGYNSSNGEYTIAEDGTYQIEIGTSITFAGTADGRDYTVGFTLNGSDTRQWIGRQVNPELTYYPRGVWSIDLKTNDVIRPFFRKEGTSAFNYNNSSDKRLHGFNITKSSAGNESGRFLSVPNGEKLINTFAMTMNASGTIISQSTPNYFSHCELSGTAGQTARCYYTTPKSSAPIPTLSLLSSAYQAAIVGVNADLDSVAFTTWNGGVSQQMGAHIQVELTGDDRAPDIIGVPVSIQGQTHEQDSMVKLFRANGHGSTNTKIPRFTTLEESIGSAITYVDSATDGASFTINESGTYHISFSSTGSGATHLGITKNSTALTTAVNGIANEPFVLAMNTVNTSGHVGNPVWQGYLKSGDVIRPHSEGSVQSSSGYTHFTMSKVGTQPLLDGGLVERPGSMIRLAGALRIGTGGGIFTLSIPNTVDSTAIATGDIKYTRDTVNGDTWEVLEDGVYSINASLLHNNTGGTGYHGFGLNSSNTSQINSLTQEQRLVNCPSSGSSHGGGTASWTGRLYKGDIIRWHYGSAGNLDTVSGNAYQTFTMAKLGQTVKYSSRVYKEDPIAWQRKNLSANTTTNTQSRTEMDFNNLEVGRTYRLSLSVGISGSATGVGMRYVMNGTDLIQTATNSATAVDGRAGNSVIFTATAASITAITITGGSTIVATHTYGILEELPFHAQTSKWS